MGDTVNSYMEIKYMEIKYMGMSLLNIWGRHTKATYIFSILYLLWILILVTKGFLFFKDPLLFII